MGEKKRQKARPRCGYRPSVDLGRKRILDPGVMKKDAGRLVHPARLRDASTKSVDSELSSKQRHASVVAGADSSCGGARRNGSEHSVCTVSP